MRHQPEVGIAASMSLVTVSQMFVSEISVANVALIALMKQSSAGVVTEGQRIGYVRVSTVAQTLDQQNEALEAAGVSKTFSDTMSGVSHLAKAIAVATAGLSGSCPFSSNSYTFDFIHAWLDAGRPTRLLCHDGHRQRG
jgi:Resolvase, N terminal domain